MVRHIAQWSLVVLVGFSVLPGAWSQQPATESAGLTPLGIRQQRVERMMEEVERKFKRLAQTLQQTEPERAELLIAALQQAKQMLVQEKMAEITKLLDGTKLDAASTEQKLVMTDLRKLLAILTEEKNDREKIVDEYNRLQEWKKDIENLISEERGLKRESEKVGNKEQSLDALQKQIQTLEGILERERGIVKQTEQARAEGPLGLTPLAGDQKKLRGETEKLADEISKQGEDPTSTQSSEGESGEAKPGEGKPDNGEPAEGKSGEGKPGEGKPGEGKPGQGKPGEGKPGEGKPGEGKPGEGKPGEGKPGEGKPGEGKPGEGKPGEGKPGEGKPGEVKPGEGKPGEGKPGEGKPGEGSPSEGKPGEGAPGGESSGGQPAGSPSGQGEKKRPPEPGERNLQQAAQHQKQAEADLAQGKGKAAQESEEKAVAELERALQDLKQEKQRIASLPPEAFDRMAGKQDDAAKKAGDLEQKMQQASAKGSQGGEGGEGGQGGQGGEGGEGGEQKQSPGQKSVQKAQQEMQQASGDLREKDPNNASRKQQKSIKELEKALQEIEERLAQLREDTQLEKLARLEARFREMLARQQQASAATADLHKRRDEMGELKRADRLLVGKVGVEEIALAESAQQAYDIIFDDGTSIVFVDVVGSLREDLFRVAEMLEQRQTDDYVQSQQKEIEITLQELIDALQQAQKQKEAQSGGGGGGGGGGGNEPLLPGSAELKLLRAAQFRINRKTEAIDSARASKGELNQVLKEDLQTTSRRQSEIAEMTIRILERGN